MFSVYLFKDDADKVKSINELKENITNACTEARKIIAKMGFPSMHSNILLKDLSKDVNWVTGEGGVGGYATRKGKYMTVSLEQLNNPNYLIKVIIHEWAHLWMFNNSKGFKNAVKEYYNTLLNQYKTNFSTSQKQKEKEPFRNVTKNKNFEKTEQLLGRGYSDVIWTEVIKNIMYTVRDIYQSYVSNKYDEDNSLWKVDDQEFFKGWRDNFKSKIRRLISKIIENMQIKSQFFNIDIEIYKKQLNYLSNAITKLFYDELIKKIKYSVESDELDWKWAKEDGEEWVLKFPRVSDYLYSETNNNENFVFTNNSPLTDVSNKFDELDDNRHGIIRMILNFVYNIFENTINQQNFPQSQDKLVGKGQSPFREEMKNLVKWVDSYGMANDDELWATGVDSFLKLPSNHRKAILNLMSSR